MARRSVEYMGWDDAYFYAAYVHDALELAGKDGDKEAGDLAPPLATRLDEWEKFDKACRDTRRAWTRGAALVKRRDFASDERVTLIHNDTLHEVKQNKKAPLYERFFPNKLRGIVRFSLISQLPLMRTLLAKILEPQTPPRIRDDHAKKLEQEVDRGQQAVTAHDAELVAQTRATENKKTWCQDTDATLLGVEGELKVLASNRRIQDLADWLGQFFPSTPRKDDAGDAAPPGTTAPAPSPSAPSSPSPGAPHSGP